MAEIALDERVSYLEGWREGIDPRLAGIEQLAGRIDSIDERHNIRFDTLDAKVDRYREELSGQINTFREELSGQINTFREELSGQINALDAKVDRFREELSGQISGQINLLREEIRDQRKFMFQLFFGGFGFLAILMTIFKFIG